MWDNISTFDDNCQSPQVLLIFDEFFLFLISEQREIKEKRGRFLAKVKGLANVCINVV